MRSKIWKRFFQAAEEAAKKDDLRSYLLGAVAERSDGAIVTSCNGPTPKPNRKLHAEYRISKKLDHNAIVYVVRVLRDGSFGNAMPCSSCLKMLRSRRVKRIYFTIDNDKYGVIPLDYNGNIVKTNSIS